MRYSVQPRDRIFVKGYRFLYFAKNMGKSIAKTISKNFSGKYSQNLLDHAKKSEKDALKTSSKRVIQKTAEAIGDLIGDKIADAVTKSYLGRITKVQMRMLKKYLKEHIYLQKKTKIFLIIVILIQ